MKLVEIVLVYALLAATPVLAQNLVQNGDFTETSSGLGQLNPSSDFAGVTTLTDWSSTGFNVVMATADQEVTSQYCNDCFGVWDQANGGANTWSGIAPAGNFVALDGDDPGCGSTCTGPITQTVALTQNVAYLLTFDYAFGQQYNFYNATIQNITVSIGGVSWTSRPNYDLPSTGFSGWSSKTLYFTASSASEVLSFLAYGNMPVPPEALVSDVSIMAAPTPEPGVWAMILVGLAGLGILARRRRAARPAAA